MYPGFPLKVKLTDAVNGTEGKGIKMVKIISVWYVM